MKPIKISSVVFGVAVLISVITLQVKSNSSAFPAYRAIAVKQFHLVDKRVACTYCHMNSEGGAPWNVFGQEVQNELTDNFPETLYNVLKAKTDADNDGYYDALEVFAGTLPGNKDSLPLVDTDTLQKNFAKAGGLELYKPE